MASIISAWKLKKKHNNEVNFKSIAKDVTFVFLKYTNVLQI